LNETIEEFPGIANVAHTHSLHVDRFIVMLDESVSINEALRIIPTCIALIELLTAKKTIMIAMNFIL
jgi:hypothetical protein